MFAKLNRRPFDLFDQERPISRWSWWAWSGIGFLIMANFATALYFHTQNLSARAEARYESAQTRKRLEENLAAIKERAESRRMVLHDLWSYRAAKETLFLKDEGAIYRGDEIIFEMLRLHKSTSVSNYIGKSAVFFGGGPLPDGEYDLRLHGGVTLRTQIQPLQFDDIRGANWTAFVYGQIVSIDYESKTISMNVLPENWILGDTQ